MPCKLVHHAETDSVNGKNGNKSPVCYISHLWCPIDQPGLRLYTYACIYTFILFTKLIASTKSTGFFSSCSLIA
jgi:hypothetical protein